MIDMNDQFWKLLDNVSDVDYGNYFHQHYGRPQLQDDTLYGMAQEQKSCA